MWAIFIESAVMAGLGCMNVGNRILLAIEFRVASRLRIPLSFTSFVFMLFKENSQVHCICARKIWVLKESWVRLQGHSL